MTTWQDTPGAGYYPGQEGQGYPYPNQQNRGYPPNQGYPPPPPPGYNPGYPPPYAGGNPPAPGFVSPIIGAAAATHQPGMYGSSYDENAMDDEAKGFAFSDKTIRNGFIRKVYAILMCQLLITLTMIATCLYHAPTQHWIRRHSELFWISFAVTIVLIIVLSCCHDVRRKSPLNYIFLFIFTLAEGFLLATASSTYKSEEVLLAVGITAAVCLGLTVFAFQTKWDFTMMHGILFVAVIVLLVFGIIAIFIPGKIITLIYASLGALIFSMYLVYDTQMMVGGKHKYSISPEDYIFAALNLYLDIINIFLYILTIIGASRD